VVARTELIWVSWDENGVLVRNRHWTFVVRIRRQMSWLSSTCQFLKDTTRTAWIRVSVQ